MLQASSFRLIHLQLKWVSYKIGVARLQRGKNPKTKVLQPRINTLGLKSLNLLEIVLSVPKKATKLQNTGKRVSYSLCLHLKAKNELKIKNQFPNMEIDFEKECLWMLSWFLLVMRSYCQLICCYSSKAAIEMQQYMLLHH